MNETKNKSEHSNNNPAEEKEDQREKKRIRECGEDLEAGKASRGKY